MKTLGRPEKLPSPYGFTSYFGKKLHALLIGKKEPSIKAREHWRALTEANRNDWLTHITIAALNSTRLTGGRSLGIAFDLSPELTAYVLPYFLRVAVSVRADQHTHGRAAYPKKRASEDGKLESCERKKRLEARKGAEKINHLFSRDFLRRKR
jgi:hypothetical protein